MAPTGCDEPDPLGPWNAEPTFRTDPVDTATDCLGQGSEGLVCEEGVDSYYAHPLQGVQPVNGLIPFVDTQIAPSGKRYALMSGGYELAEGEYVDLGEQVIEIEREFVPAPSFDDPVAFAHDVIAPRLQHAADTALAQDALETELEVRLTVHRIVVGTAMTRMHRAIAEGAVDTQSDYALVRQAILDEMGEDNATDLAPLVAYLQESGATIDYVGSHVPTIQARIPASLVFDLSARPDLLHADLDTGVTALASNGGADGQQRAEAMQYWDNWYQSYSCGPYGLFTCNYDGKNGTFPTNLHAAVIDGTGFRATHVAFRDGSGSASRIATKWTCGTSGCSSACCSVSSWGTPADGHGTNVLGALIGDYRDGQDSNITTQSQREQYSAAAGEARAHLYAADKDHHALVFDHIANTVSPKPAVVVSSSGDAAAGGEDFSDCNGDTSYDAEVDANFENGFPYFVAAGNDLDNPGPPQNQWDTKGIYGNALNCTMFDPASALGSFPVAAYDPEFGHAYEIRESEPWPESSWGGSPVNSQEGRLRTSIGLAGPWFVNNIADVPNDTAHAQLAGTSAATPAVASAALAFIDFMKNKRGTNSVDDPGWLYAWMLNMGDRGTGAGGTDKLTTGFDQRFGAGRANLRYITGPGMDSPWYWYQWQTCIDQNEVAWFNIGGGNILSSDLDSIRITAWWYDRRFKDGTALDDVDLYLNETAPSSPHNLVKSESSENRERIYYNGVGGKAIRVGLYGKSITADNEGCGTNSMRVWVTVLAEDDDRDDAIGPTWNPTTEEGVQLL